MQTNATDVATLAEAEYATKQAQLKAQWDALSPSEQQRRIEALAAKRAKRAAEQEARAEQAHSPKLTCCNCSQELEADEGLETDDGRLCDDCAED